MRKRRPAGSTKSPIQFKCARNSGKPEKTAAATAAAAVSHDDVFTHSKSNSRHHAINSPGHAHYVAKQDAQDGGLTPIKLYQQQSRHGYEMAADPSRRTCRTRNDKNVLTEVPDRHDEIGAKACKLRPSRKLGLNKPIVSPLPLTGTGGGGGVATKRKRKARLVISDDSDDDDVIEIKEPLSLTVKNEDSVKPNRSKNQATTSTSSTKLISPEYRRKYVGVKQRHLKQTPSPRLTTVNGISDRISPRPTPPINTPLRTILDDVLLSSPADSQTQVDVKWDFRSPNAFRDAKMYRAGNGNCHDGSDLIEMLKHVEKQVSPEHFGTPPPAPIFSMICHPTGSGLTHNTQRERTVRMARRKNLRNQKSKNAQSEFLQKLAEYIQHVEDQTDGDEEQNDVDIKNEEDRSPKLLKEEDLDEAVYCEDISFAGEEELFAETSAATSKIATQLEPSPVLNPVLLSASCGALKLSPKSIKEEVDDLGLLLNDTLVKKDMEKDLMEKQDVKPVTNNSIDAFAGDDTLDDLFGDESFMEKATQMTNVLFDEKTKKFNTPKVSSSVVTKGVSIDLQKTSVSSASTFGVPSGTVGSLPLRQKLFAPPSVSRFTSMSSTRPSVSAASAARVVSATSTSKNAVASTVSSAHTVTTTVFSAHAATSTLPSTCVVNSFATVSKPCVSFPNNVTKTNVSSAGQTSITKTSGIQSGQGKPPTFQNNQWTKPAAVSNIKPQAYNTVQGQRTSSNVCSTKTGAPSNTGWTKKTPSVITQNVVVTKGPISIGSTSSVLGRAWTIPTTTISGSCDQTRSTFTNCGANIPLSKSSTYPTVKTVPRQIKPNVVKTNQQCSAVPYKPMVANKSVPSVPKKTDSAIFGDLSLSEDLLFQLAEPDDILDSQICNSGSSSGSVEQNRGHVEHSQTNSKTIVSISKGVKLEPTNLSNGSKPNTSVKQVSGSQSWSSHSSGCKTVISGRNSSAPTDSVSGRTQASLREASTLILEDSVVGIPPTPQCQSKFTRGTMAPKFNFKSTSPVTRSQTKSSTSATMVKNKVPPKIGSGHQGALEQKPTDLGLDDDDDDLFEPQILAMLENAENQASQPSNSSQPSSQNQCSAEQIEKKKQQALKRRIEKKRQEAIKRREAQLMASQNAHALRSNNVDELSQSRKNRKS